jgi:hypothetical protein
MAAAAAAETFVEEDVQRQVEVGRQQEQPSWSHNPLFGGHNRFCNEVKLTIQISNSPKTHPPKKKTPKKMQKKQTTTPPNIKTQGR